MTWHTRAAPLAAALVLLAACSGDVRLPAPIALPATSVAPASTVGSGATTTTVADASGCVSDPVGARDPATSPTRSYEPVGALPAPGAMPAGSTMAAIAQRGRLIVGVSADTLLFGARSSETGQIEGFDIDVLKAIAAAIFGTTNIDSRIEFKVITYADRLPDLMSGDVDLVAHTMTINCARWQQIAFSSEYFAAGQRVLVKVGSPYSKVQDLVDGKATVCAPDGSTNLDELEKPEYDGLKLISKPDITDCLVAMQQGDADAASGDDTVLAGFAKQDPNTKVVGTTFTNEPYGIGVNKANVDLVEFVNGVLEQMRTDGEWTALYAKWLVPTLVDTDADIPPPPQALYGRPLP
jgi:polar amino acid transport system substrate-binding protein